METTTKQPERKLIGDRCDSDDECSFDNAVCHKVVKKCRCLPEFEVTNHIDKCGKPRSMNESCNFTEQCEHTNYQTECRGGRCQCRLELRPIVSEAGTFVCTGSMSLVRRQYGDRCESEDECSYDGGTCDEEDKRCRCLPEFEVTDHVAKCDKPKGLNESCTFTEQCEHTDYQSECRDGLCACRQDATLHVRPDGSALCEATERPESKKFGDKCEEDEECSFQGGMCDKVRKMCQCHPDLEVTDHVDKCGKRVLVYEECIMNEQCTLTENTECKSGRCACTGDLKPVANHAGVMECVERGKKLIGDKCNNSAECGFDYGACDTNKKCRCLLEYPITNHIDKCSKEKRINESCDFNEQCESFHYRTECRDGRCMCRYELSPVVNPDGTVGCVAANTQADDTRYVDPAMIGVLVGMALMFIILCVVLRLFSKARWRENRTIFNTPNPRLMNVSLLRDSKLLHTERRGSRSSVRAPSRQPSMASLRPQSPTMSQGSRRGSKASSNASATSTRSPKSPTRQPTANNTAADNVTIEVRDPKA